jgi:hypothetical protein
MFSSATYILSQKLSKIYLSESVPVCQHYMKDTRCVIFMSEGREMSKLLVYKWKSESLLSEGCEVRESWVKDRTWDVRTSWGTNVKCLRSTREGHDMSELQEWRTWDVWDPWVKDWRCLSPKSKTREMSKLQGHECILYTYFSGSNNNLI